MQRSREAEREREGGRRKESEREREQVTPKWLRAKCIKINEPGRTEWIASSGFVEKAPGEVWVPFTDIWSDPGKIRLSVKLTRRFLFRKGL